MYIEERKPTNSTAEQIKCKPGCRSSVLFTAHVSSSFGSASPVFHSHRERAFKVVKLGCYLIKDSNIFSWEAL